MPEALQKYKIIPTVVSVPTIRSLDDASILEFCKSHRSIVICEEN
ncbi:transketolase C-terminal domain-containing protein [Bartonella kosoyi]|nr:transketolase C-terminal domain-containing protein [Bartonella kosoyi]